MIFDTAKLMTGLVGCTRFSTLNAANKSPQNRRKGGFVLKVEKKISF